MERCERFCILDVDVAPGVGQFVHQHFQSLIHRREVADMLHCCFDVEV